MRRAATCTRMHTDGQLLCKFYTLIAPAIAFESCAFRYAEAAAHLGGLLLSRQAIQKRPKSANQPLVEACYCPGCNASRVQRQS